MFKVYSDCYQSYQDGIVPVILVHFSIGTIHSVIDIRD